MSKKGSPAAVGSTRKTEDLMRLLRFHIPDPFFGNLEFSKIRFLQLSDK